MIKTILVPATGYDTDGMSFTTALAIGRRFGAHLDVLHVRADAAEIAAAFVPDPGGGMMSIGLIELLEEEATRRAEKAERGFMEFCKRESLTPGVPGQSGRTAIAWHQEVGREAEWVVDYGRTSDLLVVGRPSENQGVSPGTLEAALMESGRPVLIPGAVPVDTRTIAIAWKPTREAARAVSAAMPLIEQATRVIILTLAEEDRVERDSATRLRDALQRQGVGAEIQRLQKQAGGTPETLLAAAGEVGAGLLVMGGYGHSRLREMVFGGMTAHILRAASIPVLMAH
jgi:nucleotide-binding universal stress UspA family protein